MKAVKNNHIIEVTEKAYRIIYKELGYKPLDEYVVALKDEPVVLENKDSIIEDGEGKIDMFQINIDDISKDKIIETLKQRGIGHNPRDKKETLYNLMIEGD